MLSLLLNPIHIQISETPKMKIKKMHGKKGQVFMPLFFIVTLIIFPILYLDLAAKTEQFENEGAESNKIGEKQLAVLKASQEAEKAQLYLDLAAQYAYGTATAAIAKQNYLSADECSFYRGVPVVYGTEDCMLYGYDLQKALQTTLSEETTTALLSYIEEYPSLDLPTEEYFITFIDGFVQGKSSSTLDVPIVSITSQNLPERIADQNAPASLASDLITLWPVEYQEQYITSCFGYREIKEGSKYHQGVDIRAHGNVPVHVVLSGTVISVDPIELGKIVVDHGNGISTAYLHLQTIVVQEGQAVQKGDILGTSGNIGTKYEHLHFELIDTNIQHVTDQYGYEGVLGEGKVNPLCFFSSTLSYKYNPELLKNCVANGGYLRFCDLYAEQTGVTEIEASRETATKKQPVTTYKVSKSTTAMLQQIDANYGEMIEDAIEGTSISKALVIGLIAQESSGNPKAGSGTGCQGLMQFCGSTAKGYGLCDNNKCSGRDDRRDPEKAIPAGVKLLSDDINLFSSSYTDREAFGLASYNGGAAIVKDAIEATGKKDPTWEEVSAALTADIVGKYLKGKNFDQTEERNVKVREISEYPRRVQRYAAAYESLEK